MLVFLSGDARTSQPQPLPQALRAQPAPALLLQVRQALLARPLQHRFQPVRQQLQHYNG